jgi:hypothetical protein
VHAVKGDGHYLLVRFAQVYKVGMALAYFINHHEVAGLSAPVAGVVTQRLASIAFQ